MPARRRFTLIELLVVVAIIAVLAAMLLPVLANARMFGQAAACSSQMKQLGVAFNAYVGDNDGTYPFSMLRLDGTGTPSLPDTCWDKLLSGYLGGPNYDVSKPQFYLNSPGALLPRLPVLVCPSDPYSNSTNSPRSYAINISVGGSGFATSYAMLAAAPPARDAQIRNSEKTILAVETPSGASGYHGYQGGYASEPCDQSGALLMARNPTAVVAGNPPYTVYGPAPANCATHPGSKFNYLYCDGHVQPFFPLDTDTRAGIGGAPRSGMRGFNVGPTGYPYYWYNNGSAWPLQ